MLVDAFDRIDKVGQSIEKAYKSLSIDFLKLSTGIKSYNRQKQV